MITLRRCTMVPMSLDFVEEIFDACTNSKVTCNMTDGWPGWDTIEGAEAFVKETMDIWPPIRFAARKKGKLVGWIGLNERGEGFGETEGFVVPSLQGMGIGVEVLPAMACWGFLALRFRSIFSLNLQSNKPMKRILENSGYRYQGLRQEGTLNGEPCWQDVYSVKPEELVLPRDMVIDWTAVFEETHRRGFI